MDRKLERWLDRKKETDMVKSFYGTDPYVDNESDIFDLYRQEDEGTMDDYYDMVIESGVDTSTQKY